MSTDITISIDTRENKPWHFDTEDKLKTGYKTKIIGTKVETISEGDYKICEHPKLIVAEKKAGFYELIGNYATKDNKDRFYRELERMNGIKYKFLLIETSLSNDILRLSIPQFKWAIPMSKIYRWTEEIEMEFGVKTRFVGDAGAKIFRTLVDVCAKKEL